MKEKFSQLRPGWRRLILSLLISFLFFISRPRRRRARVHWLGNMHRPRRFERPLIFAIIFVALPVFEFDQYLLWLSAWGGGAAVFINLCAAYKLIPRRRYHWVSR